MISEHDIFRTSDFGQIIFLLCNDCDLLGAERVAPKRVALIFRGKANCEGLISNMMFADNVSLTRALGEIRKVRQIIHQTP